MPGSLEATGTSASIDFRTGSDCVAETCEACNREWEPFWFPFTYKVRMCECYVGTIY